jgi:2-polyprenyl-3-methyl-5-hydroxy-6-metoxy-1,4-benzoquinol methylase
MGISSLRVRESDAVEIMDGPDCDPQRLERTYAEFRYINAVVSGWRAIYRRDIRPLLSASENSTLLDVGAGGGDVARALARWAVRDRVRLSVTAIDPDARAHAFAISQPALFGLQFRQALSSELVAEGARFDFVVSNHVLHHLDAAELGGLLFDSERLCRRRVLHADIERSAWGYAGFGVGTFPFFRDSYIREDGLTSIRRSFTARELRAALVEAGLAAGLTTGGVASAGRSSEARSAGPAGWHVTREVPSRLVLRWVAPRATPVGDPLPPLSSSLTLPVEFDRQTGGGRPERSNSARESTEPHPEVGDREHTEPKNA